MTTYSRSILYHGEFQQKAMRYIKWYYDEVGTGPTIREIQAAMGVKSTSTALALVEQLEGMKLIKRDPRHRRISLVGDGGVHQHDWRVASALDIQGTRQELTVECLTCNRRTAVEHQRVPSDPSTWLRYVGEIQ